MQEAGIPVTYGYISDIHERKPGQTSCTTVSATGTGFPLGPGDPCYLATAKAYDDVFTTFFARLAKAGITPANTVFVIGAEEGDHLSGANTLRASKPSPVTCDGVTVPCHYAADQIRRLFQVTDKAWQELTALLDGPPADGPPRLRKLLDDEPGEEGR
jgi:hypothetical protein